MHPHLRVARPTDHMPDILRFYRDGLGLEVIASFENHEGFDGIMLGHPTAPYHFEFTVKHGHAADAPPRKITSSSSTCRMPPNGKPPLTAWHSTAFNPFPPSIPIGINRVKPSKMPMVTASSSKTPHGLPHDP